MAIIDPNLVMNLPKPLTAFGGIDAVAHSLESYVSIMATEFTDGQALQALKLLKDYLPQAYRRGASDPMAREKVHYAATIAGMAFANAFLGVCHSMAHKTGRRIPICRTGWPSGCWWPMSSVTTPTTTPPSSLPSRNTTGPRPATAMPRLPKPSAWVDATNRREGGGA